MNGFIPTIVVECLDCKWIGRAHSQRTVYGKQYKYGYITVCPTCNSENLNGFEDPEFKVMPRIVLPFLGG